MPASDMPLSSRRSSAISSRRRPASSNRRSEAAETICSVVSSISFSSSARGRDPDPPAAVVTSSGRSPRSDREDPPSESTRLASALGPLSTLAWYANGGHALYGEIPAWTADVAYWLRATQQRQSTRVDDIGQLTESWREALYEVPERESDWDDDLESARLLRPDEVEPRQRADERRLIDPEGEGSAEPEEPEPQLDDEYSRAFSARPQRRRATPRRRPAPLTRHDDLPGDN